MIFNPQASGVFSSGVQEDVHAYEPEKSLLSKSFSYWKAAVLGVLAIASAYVVGDLLSDYVFTVPHTFAGYGGWLLLAGLCFGSFFLMAALSVERMWLLFAISVLSGAAVALHFYAAGGAVVLGASGVFILLIIYGAFVVRRQLDTAIQVRFLHTASMTVSRLMLAFAILIAAVVFASASSSDLDENNLIFPRSMFDSMLPTFSRFSGLFLGEEIDLNMTVRDFAQRGVDQALEKNGSGDIFRQSISPDIRLELVRSSTAELEAQISSFFGTEVSGDERLSDVIYGGLLAKFNALDGGARDATLLILAVLLVFTIQLLAFFLKIILIPFAFLIYEVLLISKFFTLTFENRKKESVRLL